MTLYLALIVAGALLAVAVVAVAQTRAARVALRACEETGRQSGQLPQNLERVGQLAGDIAHDLNDLLTAIIGHSELLIERLPRGDPMGPDAHEVRRAALSAARLTKQLLALSRSQRTTLEVIDVNAVVARTAGGLKGMLGEDIAVTLTLGPDIKRIKAGASHLEEIVLNLALNARDAMPAGGRLTLTTAMHTQLEQGAASGPAGEYVRLIVADTGVGIPESQQAKIFEPFFAAHGAGESAVGLAKVFAIVKENGGQIHLDSTTGVGTTFTVDLPAMSELPPIVPPPPVLRPMTGLAPILVVEDEPRVRELMRLVLVRAGYDVVAVAGPHDALAALHRQPDINLLLIDVVMPEMNGYDLAAEARRIVPAAKVVFLSGFACDPSRQPPTDGFLAKPFTVESLTDIVHHALAEL
jgi:two-component system, cell cycle sensor histidine kinase and response regulator CckA